MENDLNDEGFKEKIVNQIAIYTPEAERIYRDKEKTQNLIEKALKKVAQLASKFENVPKIGVLFENIHLLCDFLTDFINGEYTEVPKATLIWSIIALIYFISPIDLIPDVIPFIGIIDDIMVVKFVFSAIESDLKEYKAWKENK